MMAHIDWLRTSGLIASIGAALIAIRAVFIKFSVESRVKTVVGYMRGTNTIHAALDSFKQEFRTAHLVINQKFDLVTQNQEAQQRNEAVTSATLTTLMNTIGTNLFKTDEYGDWIFVNNNLCNTTGIQEDDLIGKGWINIIAPSDRSRVVKELHQSVKDGRTAEIDFSLINRDKKLLHAIMRTEKIECAKEVHFGFIGNIILIEN